MNALSLSGPALVALLALAAIVAVLFLVVADHLRDRPEESSGPVVIDQAGRLIATTRELPVYTAGRHRAQRRWTR